MSSDFPRILTLLRKEKGLSQKKASEQLGISQALLSHYEKGIRECGLDFLVRCADFYGVSCDYLLGLSPDRHGLTLSLDDIPDPEQNTKENRTVGSILPILNKKLMANSLNILFDLLGKAKNKALTVEISSFLMISCYRVFRVLYSANPKNQEQLFQIPSHISDTYAGAAMQVALANAFAIAKNQPVLGMEPISDISSLAVSTQLLSQNYPLFSSSLLNLIQGCEQRIGFGVKEPVKK